MYLLGSMVRDGEAYSVFTDPGDQQLKIAKDGPFQGCGSDVRDVEPIKLLQITANASIDQSNTSEPSTNTK